jgi:hypothetical protein
MKWCLALLLACGVSAIVPDRSRAQSANTPDYFVPLAQSGNKSPQPDIALTNSWQIPNTSPIVDNVVLQPRANGTDRSAGSPWYETDLGIAGIGLAATGAAMLLDSGGNKFVYDRMGTMSRNDSLHAADALELAPVAFAALTTVQSGLSDPELAHASSIAVTSVVAVTLEATALKFAVGRSWATGPNSDPFNFHPFDASRSTLNVGHVVYGDANIASFPSGNTAVAFAVITPYAEIYHAPWLYAIPVAVGLGRVAAPRPQWVSDVVAGGFLGWLTADMTRRLFPNSDYGLMIFGDGRSMSVSLTGRF